jgi:primase-polymerase (primpol)-like protein
MTAALWPLRNERRWCCWRLEERDGRLTKVPLQPNGTLAKSNDPSTWSLLPDCEKAVTELGAAGVGVFLGPLEDGIALAGIDLDLCRSPDTGELPPWAEPIVNKL